MTTSENAENAGPPVSMTILAHKLGLSVATVSRALSGYYRTSARTKQRVLTMAQTLNYQPNQLASALRKGQSRQLGVVVPAIGDPHTATILQAMEQAARQAGYMIIICQSNDDGLLERRHIDTLLNAQVAGILVSMAHNTQDFSHFDQVNRRGVPLLFFDNAPADRAVNSVLTDDYSIAYQATCHLLAQGCMRIAHLAGPQHVARYRQCRQGYLDALAKAGLPPDEHLISYSDLKPNDGVLAMQKLLALPAPPDGVFSANDSVLAGARQVVKLQGNYVPQQVPLAGCGNAGFTPFTEPLFTSVDQLSEEIGRAAVRLFLKLATTESGVQQQVVVRPKLVRQAASVQQPSALER